MTKIGTIKRECELCGEIKECIIYNNKKRRIICEDCYRIFKRK